MELFTGLFLSLCPPLLFIPAINILRCGKTWRTYLWMVVLAYSVLAYAFVPNPNADLSRYFLQLTRFEGVSLIDSFTVINDGMHVKNLLFWFIGNTGAQELLPAITVAIVYGISGYITCSYAEKKKLFENSSWSWILIAQFTMLPFYSIVNNVRNVMAFAIMVLAVYRELVEKKRNLGTYLLYVLPCLIHSAAYMLLIMRLLVGFARKHKYIAMIIAFLMNPAIDLAYENISLFSFSSLAMQWIRKAYRYASDEYAQTSWGQAVATGSWHKLNFALCMFYAILIIIIILTSNKKYRNGIRTNEKGEENFQFFCYLVCIMILSCSIFNAPHYWRFAMTVTIMFGFIILFNSVKLNMHGLIQLGIWCCVVLMFCLQMYYLVPRILKSDWMINFLTANPIIIFLDSISLL